MKNNELEVLNESIKVMENAVNIMKKNVSRLEANAIDPVEKEPKSKDKPPVEVDFSQENIDSILSLIDKDYLEDDKLYRIYSSDPVYNNNFPPSYYGGVNYYNNIDNGHNGMNMNVSVCLLPKKAILETIRFWLECNKEDSIKQLDTFIRNSEFDYLSRLISNKLLK